MHSNHDRMITIDYFDRMITMITFDSPLKTGLSLISHAITFLSSDLITIV